MSKTEGNKCTLKIDEIYNVSSKVEKSLCKDEKVLELVVINSDPQAY